MSSGGFADSHFRLVTKYVAEAGAKLHEGAPLPSRDLFHGLVYQVGEKSGNMIIKYRQATSRFGMEVMLPRLVNPEGATLGDRVIFRVLE